MSKDANDALDKQVAPEQPKLESAEVQHARNANGQSIAVTEGLRTNASDGSLRDRAKFIAEQEESIQIMGVSGRIASRQSRLSEGDLGVCEPAEGSIGVREPLVMADKEPRALVEGFGCPTDMPASSKFDRVQQLADKTYNSGQFADTKSKQPLAVPNAALPDTDHDNITLKPVDSTHTLLRAGLDYNDVQVPLSQKLADFAKSAQARLLEPKERQAYFQGILDEISGVGEGLSIAKDEVKDASRKAAAKAWTAVCDGSVAKFMATPNAINEPLFKTIGSCVDVMKRDPNAVNSALIILGRELEVASDKYSKMSPHDRGVQDGKAMFFFFNPEGSTEAGNLALKAADRLATHVDKTVVDGITKAMQTADGIAQATPELAAQSRQIVQDYMQRLGIAPKELQYACVPSRYVEQLRPANDNILMMKEKPHDFIKNLDGLNKVDEFRVKHGVANDRNIAYADVDIAGQEGTLVGVSGEVSPEGTVAMPANPRFDAKPRGFMKNVEHSEKKILESIAEKITESTKGTIKLFTERQPCDSCEGVIEQFREAFKGRITLIVEYGLAKRN